MINIKKFKPNYLIFLKHQVFISADDVYLNHDSNAYVERKVTKRLSRGLQYGALLLTAMISSFSHFSKLNIIIQLLLIVLILAIYILVIETIHWFYAEFDKVN